MNPLTLVLLAVAVVVVVVILLVNNGKPHLNLNIREKYDEKVTGDKIRYDEYAMGFSERVRHVLTASVFLFALGYLFYRSIFLSLILCIASLWYPKLKRVQIIKKRQKKLQTEFKDALYAIYTSISSGSSATNAIINSVDDLKRLYIDGNNFIIPELEIMRSQLKMNEPIEDVLRDFGDRSSLEDVENFVEVFITSMDTGGRQADIIKSTINTIIEKIEIKREIEMLLAEKKFEARIMNLMPIIIVLFLSLSAADYLEPLFTEVLGRVIVTIVVALLLVGNMLTNRIMDIEV